MNGPGYTSFVEVLCSPISDVLKAANVTHVDLFSLDVEGTEMQVLETFPFEFVSVDVWVIEHINPLKGNFEDPNLVDFMHGKGYYFFDMLCHTIPDYIFIRKQSKIFQDLLHVPKTQEFRRNICSHKKTFLKSPKKPIAEILEIMRDKVHYPKV